MEQKEKIQTELIGSKFKSVKHIEDVLTNLVNARASCYDVKIDDGVDDDETEDCYIKKASFSFDGSPMVVRVYYGDVTDEIGYVDVADIAI